MKKKYIFLVLGLVLLDQTIKFLNLNTLEIIPNFLYYNKIYNTGGAFSLFQGSVYVIGILSLFILYFLMKELIKKNLFNNALTALILSGIIGNLIDRLFKGHVVDYIHFVIFGSDMPIFNLADAYIIVGLIFLGIRCYNRRSCEK